MFSTFPSCSIVFSNDRRVLSQCNTRPRLLYLLSITLHYTILYYVMHVMHVCHVMPYYTILHFITYYFCLIIHSHIIQNRILQPKYSILFYNSQLKGGGEGRGVNMNLSEIFRKFEVGLKVDPRNSNFKTTSNLQNFLFHKLY